MKHKCPKCSHRFADSAQQSKAAKARWKTKKAAPGPSNAGDVPRAEKKD